ncbi:MAG TPA: quinone-dependent dihydroorotate dehydrogenase [Alphaproteobacteria bacterium]|jgi:dihydroorotate dehydrogenase|nr:quinone-dependent dihydroorotate dehydrogenase [Alphaproteobacteria bacterium]
MRVSYSLVRPMLRLLDPEDAHRAAIWGLKLGLGGRESAPDDPVLKTRVWNLDFPNPVGVAAGFDKGAEVVDALLALGFGFTEAGTVTPLPQPGNPRPRLFRLDEDEGVINRLGFNSGGLAPYLERISRRQRRGIFGANVGKNREATDAFKDYETGIVAVCPYADYLVVNVSSPNTPGLRSLQARASMEELLTRVLVARNQSAPDPRRPPPLLAKVGPDLDEAAIADIAEVALSTGVDGLIVGNTTIERPSTLRSPYAKETGGLSGKPLLPRANKCLSDMYRLTKGKVPLIGCGGIASGADAYAKIRAGASLVQLYSMLVFHGPELAVRIKRDLAERLRADGFASVCDAVGADYR